MQAWQNILANTLAGKRLSSEDALTLWQQSPWTALVDAGHQMRCQRLDPTVVSYTAFRLINYTNVCDIDCSFCSFKDEQTSKRAYTLSLQQIQQKAEEARNQGADHIFFQGGVNSHLPISYYLEALQLLHHQMGFHVRGFSPVELVRMSEAFQMDLPSLLNLLKAAGLGSVPGAGAEILTERMRQILSPKKLSAQQWCATMGACHQAGLPGSANIVFGSEETDEDIITHLTYIRDQQDRTGGFLTFVPWVFQPQTKDFFIRHVPGTQYLKMVALCRLFFDNINHIEVSVLVVGKELGELGLYAGADDINSIVLEENVLRSHGLRTLRAAERFIFEAGFIARRRTLNFDFSPYLHQPKLWPPAQDT